METHIRLTAVETENLALPLKCMMGKLLTSMVHLSKQVILFGDKRQLFLSPPLKLSANVCRNTIGWDEWGFSLGG